MTEPLKQQSNPFSTGGGGGNFETRVQAAFVVLMLTGRIAPCLPAWPITRIKLQGRYAGYHTDDFIAFTQDPQSGKEAKLLAQLKHSIGITEGNETFGEVIQAAWQDFNNPSTFNTETDAFALITGPLSFAEINNTRTLLEWARHCEDDKEFLYKINTKGFSNETKKNKLEAFRFHLTKANGGNNVSDEQLWNFLKCFHLLGYDLDTESGSHLSLILSLIAQSSTENASLLWSRILDCVQTGNQTAGTITLENLPKEIRRSFNTANYSRWDQDLEKLKAHGDYIIEGIRSGIGGVHINRGEYFDKILEAAEFEQFVFLTGERGCGKSNLIKEFAEHMKQQAPVFCLRTEDLDKPHLDHVFSEIGLTSSLSQLEAGFSLIPKKYMLLESLEKLLELQNTSAFTDLIRFIQKNHGWTIIASGRDYAYQSITFNYLATSGVKYHSLVIGNLKDNEIQNLCDSFEFLQPLANNQLLKNPFYAELAYRVGQTGTRFSSSDSEREFKIAVWRDIISKEQVRTAGMPLKRKKAFIDIAVNRAKQMAYGIPDAGYDDEAILRLEEDNLIRRDQVNGLVSLAHDILEDWGLERYIDEAFHMNHRSAMEFLDAIGHEPAINRAYRLWLHQKMISGENVAQFILSILADKAIESYWQDETITAVLLSDNPYEFLNLLKDQLFDNNGELIKRFCFILRISCKTPNQELIKQFLGESSRGLNALFLNPFGIGWEAIIRFLCENRTFLTEEFTPHVISVLKEWSVLIKIDHELPNISREAGLLALHFLNMLKESYRDEGNRKGLFEVVFQLTPVILNEFNELLNNDVFIEEEYRRPPYVKDFCALALTGLCNAYLCKNNPDIVIRLSLFEWIIDDGKKENDEDLFWRSKDVPEHFGLHQFRSKAEFFPASGAKGPFVHLLRYHPRKGLDFIIKLLNHGADKYAHSDLDSPGRYSMPLLESYRSDVSQIEIALSDGTFIKQFASQRLWNGYRGGSVIPYLLQSALMALENWLVEWVEHSQDTEAIEWAFHYIIRNSNSVLPTAVLVSVATGHPVKLAKAVQPLLRIPEFYDMDLTRSILERGGKEPDWHALNSDPLAKLYSKERHNAALRTWRREHLESLITRLQFTEYRDEVLNIIDDLRSTVSTAESWQFRFHRIDSRRWESKEDGENGRIIFTTKALEPHLEKLQQEFEVEREIPNRLMSLYLWSDKVFKHEFLESEYYANWKDAYKEAKSLYEILTNDELNDLELMHIGAITKAAAIFIRDYSTEMNEEDLSWCFEIIVQAIFSNGDSDSMSSITNNFDHDSASAAATVLPKIFDFTEEEDDVYFIKKMIAYSFTHADLEVRMATGNGIKNYLWERNSEFADKCVIGAIEYSKLELEKESDNDVDDELVSDNKLLSWLEIFYESFAQGEIATDGNSISFHTHNPWGIFNACLMIPNGSTEPGHTSLFSRMLTLLFEAEVSEKENRYHYEQVDRINIPDELPMKFAECFAYHFVSMSESDSNVFMEHLQNGCNIAPEFMNSLLLHVEYFTDKVGNKKLYWNLWEKLSEKVQNIALEISRKDERGYIRDDKTKLIREMLHLGFPWQKIDYINQDIALGKEPILKFVNGAGENSDVFEAMASLMHHFPTVFLDAGLLILSKHQRDIGGTRLLSGINTTFYLVRSLQQFILVDNTAEKMSNESYQACWILLDAIIETASSEAYYLREHLIRSRRVANNLSGFL